MKAIYSDVRIVMVSGEESSEVTEACTDAGAEKFLVKGSEPAQLLNTLLSMIFSGEGGNEEPEAERRAKISRILKMVGCSREFAKVAELVFRFGPYEESVLIFGESGVGKEQIAKAIHENSPRKNKPYIAINCGALPKDLLESELFGHEKGSFTGALAKKVGLLEQANGGTIFLDEIGDMPLELQVKMLRALQEKVIQPIGGTPRKVNFRVVAATHRNLKKAAQRNEFRRDLYYRLNYLNIEVPALRERPEDIEPLIRHFLFEMQEKMKVIKPISDGAMRKLKSHIWPGNVRDLEASVKKAFALADGKITEKIVKEAIDYDVSDASIMRLRQIVEEGEIMPKHEFDQLVEQAERCLFKRALELANGKKAAAARILEISHSTMNDRRVALGLDKLREKTIDAPLSGH
jgi:two-component system response regulator PilR (NtrC family)